MVCRDYMLGYHSAMPESSPVQSFASFTALRAAAPELADASFAGDFFYSFDWFENLAESGFDPQARLELLLAGDCCLPLIDGSELHGLSNYYSALYGPLAGRAPSPAACAAIARHLHADPRRWPIIRLQPLDAGHAFCERFGAALAAAGYRVERFFCFGNWTLDVAGRSFEQYFAGLPARLQNTIRRARKKLDKAGRWQFVLHSAADHTLESGIADFEANYAASWKGAETFPRFIPQFCRLAARRGWLRLGLLRLDGVAIAAQLWLVCNGKASIFKLAYRQGYEHLSPGSVLSAEMMRQTIDVDGVGEVDYLSGDDAYKRDWMSRRRERIGLVAFRLDTLRGLAAAGKHVLGKLLRRKVIP